MTAAAPSKEVSCCSCCCCCCGCFGAGGAAGAAGTAEPPFSLPEAEVDAAVDEVFSFSFFEKKSAFLSLLFLSFASFAPFSFSADGEFSISSVLTRERRIPRARAKGEKKGNKERTHQNRLTASRCLLDQRRGHGLGETLAVRRLLDLGQRREELWSRGREGLERVGERVHRAR